MGTAVISGATGAIGSAIAKQFTNKGGMEVVRLSSSECDFSDYGLTQRYLSQIDIQDVEVLVFCAGINNPRPFVEIDFEQFQRIQNANFIAHKLMLNRFLPQMVERQYGRIVSISSLYASRARSGRWAYSASKASLETMMRSVAIEFSEYGILANSVAPGFVDTPLTHKNNSESDLSRIVERIPVRRLGNCEEIAKLVHFLASPDNTYITGQTISIDGGASIV
jgi:3-oxoacyl-[acyl-carrier protein] reductase